jgi:hypothetical protein
MAAAASPEPRRKLRRVDSLLELFQDVVMHGATSQSGVASIIGETYRSVNEAARPPVY